MSTSNVCAVGDEQVLLLSDGELRQRLLVAIEEERDGQLVCCETPDEVRNLMSRLQRQHA